MSIWKRLLAPPVFEDAGRTRVASLLNAILLTILALAALYVIVTPFVTSDPGRSLLTAGIATILILVALFLMRRGYVRFVRLLLPSALWMAVTCLALLSGGVSSPGIASAYIVTILIAGLLLGRRVGIALGGLTILVEVGLLYVQGRDILRLPPISYTLVSGWALDIVAIVVAVILLHLATRSLNDALERVRRNARNLSETNEVLQCEIAERRLVEEALQESEDRYCQSVENSPNPIFSIDREGIIRTWNWACEEVFQYRAKEIIGQVYHKLLWNPDDRSATEAMLAQVWEGHSLSNQDMTYLSRDGTRRFTLSWLYPLRDSKGRVQGCVFANTDITERKWAEETLRQYIERLRTLHAIDGAILAAWSAEGIARAALRHIRRLVPCQRASVVMFDREGQEATVLAVHANGETRVGGGTRLSLDASTMEKLRQGRIHVVEDILALPHTAPVTQVLLAEGLRAYITMPLIAQGELIGILNIGKGDPGAFSAEQVDITREIANQVAVALYQVRLRSALEAEERRLEALVEHLPEGVVLLDGERRILLSNRAAQTYLPVLTDAATGDTLTCLGDSPVEELLQPSPDGPWHELKIAGPPGRVFNIAAQPIVWEAEEEGWVLMIRDVTEERESQQRIQQQERLAAVGQLAAGIAHDFNNIMATIILYTQLLMRMPDLPARGQEHLRMISQQAKQATRLIGQILDFSRRSMLERHPVDLAPLFRELTTLLEHTLPDNIQVRFDCEPGEHMVNADPTRIQQVIMNLALNARDAMPEGGRLYIELKRVLVRPDEAPPLPEMRPGEWIGVKVADTGTGIPPDVLPHIYEPFFTTKPPGSGSGLGLAQVYGIVTQHQGHIGMETQVGRGTAFSFYLPALLTSSLELPTPEVEALAEGQGETILIVEDDAVTRAALCETLETLNYRVLAAADGQEALAVFAQHAGEIALVVSDLVMPKLGGKELISELRKMNPHLKALAITGYTLVEDVQELREQGGVLEIIQKPFDVGALAEIIRRALDTGLKAA